MARPALDHYTLWPAEFRPSSDQLPETYWNSLYYFNVSRLVIAVLLLFTVELFGNSLPFGSHNLALYLYSSAGYILFAVMSFMLINARRPNFNLLLSLEIIGDIVFIILMTSASGGISSGLSILLLGSLAAAGMISRGKLTLFYASLASIGLLLMQVYQVAYAQGNVSHYLQVALLCIGYFATAWLAHTLAKRLIASEQLAAQRGIDLANLAQVNQLIIQDMQDGVIVVDEQGLVRQLNAQAEEMLGTRPKERGGLRLSDLSKPLARVLHKWYENPHAPIEPVRSAVPHRLISARFFPVDKTGNVGAVIFLEDLSRLQSEAQQLKLAALGRLTANIAHEIRNPLSAINHATELLQEEPTQNSTQSRLLQIIHDNARRLDRMVQEVLRLNRRDRAHRELVNLTDYLKTFIEQFCEIEKISGTIFSVELANNFSVAFDRSHLNQVMWNLCRNALRHCSRQPSSIRIIGTSNTLTNAVELSVIDDGPGVPPTLRNQLFEPFFTTAASGTGLGLYIAREICDANGATLDYVETSSGAQFSILCKGK